MVCVSALLVYVVLVFAMSVHVVNGEVDDCHFLTIPVLPLKVNVPLVEPEQIVDPPFTLPPTEIGATVTVVGAEVSGVHEPL